MLKSYAVSWQESGKGGSDYSSVLPNSSRLNKALVLHEYVADGIGNWTGKLWQ